MTHITTAVCVGALSAAHAVTSSLIERALWRARLAGALTAGSGLDGAGVEDCFLLPDFERRAHVCGDVAGDFCIEQSGESANHISNIISNAISKSSPFRGDTNGVCGPQCSDKVCTTQSKGIYIMTSDLGPPPVSVM
jgi:hypothetical protein